MNPRWTWEKAICHSELRPTTRHVLLVLATYLNRQGDGAFPAYDTLAKMTGLTRSAVIRNVKAAVKGGFLAVEHRFDNIGRPRSNVYHPTFPGGGTVFLVHYGWYT